MTPPRSREDWDAIDRFVAGESSVDEANAVRRWLRDDPRLAADIEVLRAAAECASAPGGEPDAVGATPPGTAWAALASRLRAADAAVARSAGQARSPRTWPRGVGGKFRSWWPIAGAAAAALAVITGLRQYRGSKRGPEAFREFATVAGSRSSVTLRDGTRVVLAPATRLRVVADFGARARTVELDGEAYFAVVHDGTHPLTVRTSWATTRDIGTTFVVRAYPDDRRTQVVVAEGSVALDANSSAAHQLVLGPGTLAVVDSLGHVVVRRGPSLDAWLGWTQGRLAFKDTPLSDVARDLARTFDLQITVADPSLDRQLVTASFTDQSIDVILGDVTAIVGARYERSGRIVVITHRSSGMTRPARSDQYPLRTALARKAHE